MKQQQFTLCLLLALSSWCCNNPIKNIDDEVVIEEGTEVNTLKEEPTAIPDDIVAKPLEEVIISTTQSSERTVTDVNTSLPSKDSLLGFWVGYFVPDVGDIGFKESAEDIAWYRENKINISIDEIRDNIVIGHSVVAGNDRPFKGILSKELDTYSSPYYAFKVDEPGDHKYDGRFEFIIQNQQLSGNWIAFKNIEINKRIYRLDRKPFSYNPNIMLKEARRYQDWKNIKSANADGEIGEWFGAEYESATNLIYEINASNTLLTKEQVENMKRGDLTIIRNAIYARHGYSFKNRPLRVFFDAQSWYVPVHTDIKTDFTAIEKQNIQLLLRYEKNAKTYYDYFGRG